MLVYCSTAQTTQWINKQIIRVCVFHFNASTLNFTLINCGSQEFPLRKGSHFFPHSLSTNLGVVFQLDQELVNC